MLDYAALLHRIGAFLTYNNYQAHTYYLIRNANLLGFDETEIAILAATALFHRKSIPQRAHPEFAALDLPGQKIVRLLSLLLRFAESLDRSHAGNVRHAGFRRNDASHVVLHVHAVQDCQIELWAVQKHVTAFEKVLGCKLDVEVVMERGTADGVRQAD